MKRSTADGGGTSEVLVGEASTSSVHRLLIPALLQLGAMLGIAVLLYSSAADWFATLGHNAEVSGYVREIEQLPEASRIEALQKAKNYNSDIPPGYLRDPYSNLAMQEDLSSNSDYQLYQGIASIGDSGVMGELSYPEVGISLPIYHGTSEEVLTKGVGHLYGSSLPVGGSSTHSVMTSHSGLVNASLFTKLLDAEVDDTFSVTVLGTQLHYQVIGLDNVLPEETESLRILDGEDRITLITCTPLGVNSHRLLVHAQRMDAPPADTGERIVAGDGMTAGFPWWAAIFLGASAAAAYLIFAPLMKDTTAGRHRMQKRKVEEQ